MGERSRPALIGGGGGGGSDGGGGGGGSGGGWLVVYVKPPHTLSYPLTLMLVLVSPLCYLEKPKTSLVAPGTLIELYLGQNILMEFPFVASI